MDDGSGSGAVAGDSRSVEGDGSSGDGLLASVDSSGDGGVGGDGAGGDGRGDSAACERDESGCAEDEDSGEVVR